MVTINKNPIWKIIDNKIEIVEWYHIIAKRNLSSTVWEVFDRITGINFFINDSKELYELLDYVVQQENHIRNAILWDEGEKYKNV